MIFGTSLLFLNKHTPTQQQKVTHKDRNLNKKSEAHLSHPGCTPPLSHWEEVLLLPPHEKETESEHGGWLHSCIEAHDTRKGVFKCCAMYSWEN